MGSEDMLIPIDGEVEGDVNTDSEVGGEVEIPTAVYEKDYQKLDNKPSINGTELYDNYDEIDPTVPGWAKTQSKPSYTADEIGAVSGQDTIKYDEIDRMFNAVFGL